MSTQGFIAQVAERLYSEHGEGISSLCLILPSRRARLFLADALAGMCDAPLWQPAYASIDELMAEISGQRVADNVRLVTELYKVWSRYHEESFDSFYFWGEMLLADFDAVDKYLIDADMLFANVRDLKVLEADHSYLTEEQKEVVRRFWESFGAREGFSGEQEQFLQIWNTLGAIYHDYRAVLADQGLAYTGMMHRAATGRIQNGEVAEQVAARNYAVVGFNALTECEKRLFDFLRDNARVEFFWDYDRYYLENPQHEAGLFMRQNMHRYPAEKPLSGGCDNLAGIKEIVVVSAPSDTLQCKYVSGFLDSLAAAGPLDKETAVVLSDESLLETLLYSMPVSVANINVTMGYPLRQTLVYSFVERLLELQKHKKTEGSAVRFYHSDAVGLLQHPFIEEQSSTQELVRRITADRQIYPSASMLSGEGLRGAVFTPCEGWRQLGEYLVEVLSRVARNPQDKLRTEVLAASVEQVRKLCNSLENCGIELSDGVFASLLRRQLQAIRIPYEGEPLQGVQVMGFLETRALDFENVVILSVNDDVLPGNRTTASSFIPYGLKVGYGLPTAAHHEAMYAYYFYRLLQRARRIHLVYCSRSDEKRKGEPSRYIYQLDYESPHTLLRREIALDANLSGSAPISVEKNGAVLTRLDQFLDKKSGKRLSPTAFFSYIICPLRFYFRTVAQMYVEEKMEEDVDARIFGNILHGAMERLYTPLKGVPAPHEAVAALVGSPAVAQAVDDAIAGQYLRGGGEGEYGGSLQIVRDVICRYINKNILPYDASQRDICFEALEQPLGCGVEFETGSGLRTAWFYGKADRVDSLGPDLKRVVDYKTASRGGFSLVFEFGGVESLFSGDARGAGGAVVQTLLYAMMLRRMTGADVQPAIYAVRNMYEPDYSPLLVDKERGGYVRRYSDYAASFENALKGVLAEMFDPAVPFVQCEDEKQCLYCDYKTICGR